MSGTVREYAPRDIPALKELWQEAFGDPSGLIDVFFELLPNAGTGYIYVLDEKPVSMAYVLDGLSVNGKKCAYIYAVATKAQLRGSGFAGAVVTKCAEHARNSGCEIISTSPAEKSLYGWYGKILGTEAAVFSGDFTVRARNLPTPELNAEPLTAAQYNTAREKLLSNTPHVTFPDGYMAIEEMLCRVCGGGLYAVGGGVAACYPEDGELKIRELLCTKVQKHGCIAALIKMHGSETALVHDAGHASPYVAALPAGSVKNLWWGPILD